MNEFATASDAFYVCAGICREDPETKRCLGCGRPWDVPQADGASTQREPGESVVDESWETRRRTQREDLA